MPDALLGRVNASYRLFVWGTQPIGTVLGRLIARRSTWALFLFTGLITVMLLFARAIISDAANAAAEVEGAAEASRLASTAHRRAGSVRAEPAACVRGATGRHPAPMNDDRSRGWLSAGLAALDHDRHGDRDPAARASWP